MADGWFYLSAASLLVSGVLFFFLLGQYRAAVDAADRTEGEPDTQAGEHAVVRPVYAPEDNAPAAKVASVTAEKKGEQVPVPKTEPAPASTPFEGPDRRRESATGGVSPAVLYLQSIKAQLDVLNGAVGDLTKRVDSITGRDEALIERLGELSSAVAELKDAAVKAPRVVESAPAPAPAPAPTPKRAKKSEPVAAAEAAAMSLEAVVAKPAEKPVEKPAEKTVPDAKAEVVPDPSFERTFSLKKGAKSADETAPVIEKSPEPKVETKNGMSPEDTVRFELDALIETQIAAKTARKTPPPAAAPAPEPAVVKVEPVQAPVEEKTDPVIASVEPPASVAAAPAPEAEPEEKPRRGPVWPV